MAWPSGVVSDGCVVSELAVVDPAVVQSKLQSCSRQIQVIAFYQILLGKLLLIMHLLTSSFVHPCSSSSPEQPLTKRVLPSKTSETRDTRNRVD